MTDCVVELLAGDCVEQMRNLADASVDAVVTDPPYGIRFMGKAWDGTEIEEQARKLHEGDARRLSEGRRAVRSDTGREFSRSAYAGEAASAGDYDFSLRGNRAFQAWTEAWAKEALRVLKPGGFLLSFAGTRTYHRMVSGIEDAGFEIRDTIAWMFGSGFPKSHDVAKAIDSKLGAQGEYGDPKTARHAEYLRSGYGTGKHEGWDRPWMDDDDAVERTAREYLPATEEARAAKGWGTALKPAFEPVVVARKPFGGTVAENVLAHGTGGLNIDATRIGYADETDRDAAFPGGATTSHGSGHLSGPGDAQEIERSGFEAVRPGGRWPANVALGHTPDCRLLGSREVRGDGNWTGVTARERGGDFSGYEGGWDDTQPGQPSVPRLETVEEWECAPDCPVRVINEQSGEGGASRFFYVAKTSRAERNAGLDESFEAKMLRWSSGEESPGTFQSEGTEKSARNHHPTVKPIELMRWLVRLVTPAGGTVLDPFVGSGSTGCACVLEPTVGRFVGIERDHGYLAIAGARVAFWQKHGEQALQVVRVREQGERSRRELEDAGQLDLLSDV